MGQPSAVLNGRTPQTYHRRALSPSVEEPRGWANIETYEDICRGCVNLLPDVPALAMSNFLMAVLLIVQFGMVTAWDRPTKQLVVSCFRSGLLFVKWLSGPGQ